jgi:hypothetical protein
LDQHLAFGKETMQGLVGVAVTAEVLTTPGLSLEDVTMEKVRQAIENQIYESGIVVISFEGLAGVAQKPILHTKLSILPVGVGNHVYAINSFLMQRISLIDGNTSLGVTWEHGYLGLKVGEDWSSLYSSLEKTVLRFIEDYKSINNL